MKPIYQTMTDKGKGDGIRASIASLLELDITQVPHFALFKNGIWYTVLVGFMNSLGFKFHRTSWWGANDTDRAKEYKAKTLAEALKHPLDGLFLVDVKSKNFENSIHVVIMDETGIVIHDPSPLKSYKGESIMNDNLVGIYTIQLDKEKASYITYANEWCRQKQTGNPDAS